MEKVIAHTKIFDVVEKDEVAPGFKPIGINAPDWVQVIVEMDGKFLMVEQSRFGLMKEIEEFLCGTVDPGEDPLTTAVRELTEETGYVVHPSDLKKLGTVAPNPGFLNNHMHIYYVNLDKIKQYRMVNAKPGKNEKLSVVWRTKTFVKRTLSPRTGCECPAMKTCAVFYYENQIKAIW